MVKTTSIYPLHINRYIKFIEIKLLYVTNNDFYPTRTQYISLHCATTKKSYCGIKEIKGNFNLQAGKYILKINTSPLSERMQVHHYTLPH